MLLISHGSHVHKRPPPHLHTWATGPQVSYNGPREAERDPVLCCESCRCWPATWKQVRDLRSERLLLSRWGGISSQKELRIGGRSKQMPALTLILAKNVSCFGLCLFFRVSLFCLSCTDEWFVVPSCKLCVIRPAWAYEHPLAIATASPVTKQQEKKWRKKSLKVYFWKKWEKIGLNSYFTIQILRLSPQLAACI